MNYTHTEEEIFYRQTHTRSCIDYRERKREREKERERERESERGGDIRGRRNEREKQKLLFWYLLCVHMVYCRHIASVPPPSLKEKKKETDIPITLLAYILHVKYSMSIADK